MQVPGRLDVTIFLLRAFHPVVPGILEALHLPGPGMLRLTSIAAARAGEVLASIHRVNRGISGRVDAKGAL